MVTKSGKSYFRQALPVTLELLRLAGGKEIRIASGKKKIEEIQRAIEDNAQQAGQTLLEMKPDEIQDNTPAVLPVNVIRAMETHDHMIATGNLESVRHLAGVMLKTSFDRAMWGSKEVSAVFNDIRTGMREVETDIGPLELSMEKSGAAKRLIRAYVAGQALNKEAVKGAIEGFIKGFELIKTHVSRLGQVLWPLYKIDNTFKQYTGYPATWFLMSSILMDFLYEYEQLLENMVKNAEIEQKVMTPLVALKITTGV